MAAGSGTTPRGTRFRERGKECGHERPDGGVKAKIKPIELWRGNRTCLELRGDESGITANGPVRDRSRPARSAERRAMRRSGVGWRGRIRCCVRRRVAPARRRRDTARLPVLPLGVAMRQSKRRSDVRSRRFDAGGPRAAPA
ncbi:hypothetical protein BURMUCGD1_3354 [Burkholderia multivorans CGD1]|nr:hypothetical protein BURMUCGD1_3354 [Burkholderia multivorans CGD1]